MKTIRISVEVTTTGYSAYARDYPVFTTASTTHELYGNLVESVNLLLADTGNNIEQKHLKLHMDFQQFFQRYRVLNARHLAERIGMNPTLLSQYVSGKKEPSQKQQSRILEGIQAIGRELAGLGWA